MLSAFKSCCVTFFKILKKDWCKSSDHRGGSNTVRCVSRLRFDLGAVGLRFTDRSSAAWRFSPITHIPAETLRG